MYIIISQDMNNKIILASYLCLYDTIHITNEQFKNLFLYSIFLMYRMVKFDKKYKKVNFFTNNHFSNAKENIGKSIFIHSANKIWKKTIVKFLRVFIQMIISL